jgi:WD40 repeat protein
VAVLQGHPDLGNAPIHRRLLGPVTDAEFSRDGRQLVTVSLDQMPKNRDGPGLFPGLTFTPVRLWDLPAGTKRLALADFPCWVRTASFAPGGGRLLTVSRSELGSLDIGPGPKVLGDMTTPFYNVQSPPVRIWDARTGRALTAFLSPTEVCRCAVWSPDGDRVLTVAYPSGGVIPANWQPMRIWDAATGKPLLNLDKEAGECETLQFSPDGRFAVGVCNEKRPRAVVWDAATGKPHCTLEGHEGDLTAVAWSANGLRLATASADRTVRLWEAATGKELWRLSGHAGTVHAVAFSPDGARVVTASEDGTARLWDAVGKEWLTLRGHQGPVYSAAFHPDGNQVLTGSQDGTARLWPLDPLPLARERLPRTLSAAERAGVVP